MFTVIMIERRCLHLGNGNILGNMKSISQFCLKPWSIHYCLKTHTNLSITAAPVFGIIQQTYSAKGTENWIGRGPF